AYLFQAARNKSLNFLRRKKQTVSLNAVEFDIVETNTASLETEELYRLIQEAVLDLPDKCREVFHLSRNENLSNKEIAEKLGISVKTVEAQITKALKRIKDFLGDAYFYLW
ncbi:MAG: sigma-70 family RNA polymerase sigma factor, partial [Prevotellaceae bacterium]|nr:sigma-70 family RNA polymerase sigma factor [Prevotellaceae bacterium]